MKTIFTSIVHDGAVRSITLHKNENSNEERSCLNVQSSHVVKSLNVESTFHPAVRQSETKCHSPNPTNARKEQYNKGDLTRTEQRNAGVTA